eukprot:574319-Rhodomonas_salina.4
MLLPGQLYKTLAEHETASVLVARSMPSAVLRDAVSLPGLSKLSDVHVTWAAEIVEVSWPIALRARYAMSGPDLAYAAIGQRTSAMRCPVLT